LELGDQVMPLCPAYLDKLSTASLRELIKAELIEDEAKDLELVADDERVQRYAQGEQLQSKEAKSVARRLAKAEALFDEILNKQEIVMRKPSPAEIREYYQKHKDTAFRERCMVKVRSIYMDAGNDPERVKVAESKAKLVYEKIAEKNPEQKNEAFAAMASEFSDDAFARQGGQIRLSDDPEGWFVQDFPNKRPDGQPLFPDEMYRGIQTLAKKGAMTAILRSQHGFHILYMEDIKGGRTVPFDQAYKLIEYQLEKLSRNERLLQWLQDKLQRSRVTWHDGDPYPKENILPREEK